MRLLQRAAAEGRTPATGVLCVANPDHSGEEVMRHLVEDLGVRNLNLLLPRDGHDSEIWRPQARQCRASARRPDLGADRPQGRDPRSRHRTQRVPRSTAEAQRVLAMFESAAHSTNERHRGAGAEVAIMHHTVADGDCVYPAIDLYLSKPADGSWDAYFADLDTVCAALTDELVARSQQPRARD